MLLDYKKFRAFLLRYFNSPDNIKARMVGIKKTYDGGYSDIVRFYGDSAINPHDIKIKYLPGQFELKDKLIKKFAKEIEKELREQSRIYDGPLVTRVATTQFTGKDKDLVVQKCSYGMFAGSCFALDKETKLFGRHKTLREYYINRDYKGIENHPLALCLGICGILVIKDQKKRQYLCLLVERSGNLASLENSIGPSSAGSVDFKNDYKNLGDLIDRALGFEIEEELNLTVDEYKIYPLAYAREIYRGEKPQIFCMIEPSLKQKEIIERLDSIKNPEEFTGYGFVELSDILSGEFNVNHETMMNAYLLEEYLKSNE